MDKRMQPPPNYYGAPYGEPMMEGGPYRPNPGQPGYPQYPEPPHPPKGPSSPEEGFNEEKEGRITANSLHDYLRGKEIIAYCTYPNSAKWHDVIYKGRVLTFDSGHLFLYDEHEKKTTIIPHTYINYLETYDSIRFKDSYR